MLACGRDQSVRPLTRRNLRVRLSASVLVAIARFQILCIRRCLPCCLGKYMCNCCMPLYNQRPPFSCAWGQLSPIALRRGFVYNFHTFCRHHDAPRGLHA